MFFDNLITTVRGFFHSLKSYNPILPGTSHYNDSGTLPRERSFAEYEARAFSYNAAQRGRDPVKAHDVPAKQLAECLQKQLGSDLPSVADNIAATGQPPQFNTSLITLSKTVEALTNINTSLESESKASLDEDSNVSVSQTNGGDLDATVDHSDKIRQSLKQLHGHLCVRLKSQCAHEILFQTTGFEGTGSIDRTSSPQFKLLLSSCPSSEVRQWQEVCCRAEREGDIYDDDDDDDDDDDYADDDSICAMITLYQYYGCTLEVAFNHESFRYDHKQRPSSYPHGMLHTTLHDLLDRQVFSSTNMNSKTYYPLRERYLLGLNLARSLFYMFDGPWGSSNWKTDEIFFVFTHDSALEVDSHQIPYIRCSLDTTGVEEGGRRLYPTWLALAQILVEIHEGQSLQFAFEQPLGMAQLRQRILEHVDGKLEYRDGDAYYGEAIKACVNLGLELLPARRSRRKVARNLIRSKIIYNLEMNYKKWSSAPSENLDLNFTHTTSMIPFSTSNTSQISPTYATRKPITHSSSRLPPSVSILTLFDDNGSDDEGLNISCQRFFEKVARFNNVYIDPLREIQKCNNVDGKIKIAVLGSGVKLGYDASIINSAFSEGRIRHGWSTTRTNLQDTYGLGTSVTRLLLEVAPLAEIHVAKVSEDGYLDESKAQDIVDAITWAVDAVNAHIIAIPFAMQKEVKGVTKAIYSAVNRGKLIFAAAATRGSLQPRAYPACLPGVIAIHATDGYGNPAIFNPSPEEGDNFSVVGMGIKSEWEAQAVFISGTSLATAVAAGIAANILDFGRTHLNKGLDRPGLFYSYPGMRYLLRSMAPLRFQYHFISPWNIFRELSDDDIINPENAWDEVCEKLRNVITQLVALGLPSSLLDSTRIIGSSGPNLISVHEANGREMLEDDVPGQSGLQIKKGKSRKDVNRYIEYLNFLHQHQAIESHKLNDTSKVSSWLLDFLNIDAQVFEPLLKSRAFPRRIKVGVLDTGCDLSTGFFDAEHNHLDKQRITGEHWVDFLNDKIRGPVDEDGHGTKIATTLLMLLPRAEVFIGRVARKRADFSSPDIHETISTAILHAASSWEVDIITMSFGFSEVPSCIEKAIDEAVGPRMRNKRLLIFAAANNSGRNEPERFPASYLRSVISARGTYPNGGFVDDYNPDGSHAPLYGTLAVEVPCTHKWVTKERRPKVLTMSGCSIASPIMASIAATYLQYVLWKMDQLGDEDRRMSQSLHRLFEQDGMLALFSETTRNGGDRRFLAPWQLFEGKGIEKESIWQSRLVAAGSSLHQRVI